MENLKSKTADFREEIVDSKKYLSELTTEEVYKLVQYIVAVEFSRSTSINRIMSQDDIVQDIMVELYRDHETESMKALKSNLKAYINQNMTISHFINTMFLSAKQYISIYCTRQKSTIHVLQDASFDAELDDEKSNLYNIIADDVVENELDATEIVKGIPKFCNKEYYLKVPCGCIDGKTIYAKSAYTYKNLMSLYIYLYNRNEEKQIRNYIYETETKKRVKNLDKVLNGFRLCLKQEDVLTAII